MFPAGNRPSTANTETVFDRVALVALGVGALATVLAVLPYRSFDLDRFFVPKELALHVAATTAGLSALAGVRRISLTRADVLLAVWLGLSFLSALFATNHWLAARAFALSLSGAAVYWSARRLAAVGLGDALARALAAVVVVGALTALAQAYGVKLEFAALSRAPGGTSGNRNFMAHLAAAGLPLLVYSVAAARTRRSSALFAAGLAACAGALVLSRTRAAWLALMLWGALSLVILMRGPALLDGPVARRRVLAAFAAAVAGIALALIVPNTLDWKSDNPYLDSVKGVANYRAGSGRGRLRQYQNSSAMALAHPLLGVGPGNWPVIYPRHAPPGDPSIVDESGMTANPWPSSDWVAELSERGPAAMLALAGGLALLLGAALFTRWDSTTTSAVRLAAFAGAGVLGIAAIEGTFDAVLLLPAPSIVIWAAAGALVPAGPAVRVVDLGAPTRRMLALLLLVAGGSSTLLSVRKIEAMGLYTNGGTVAALERAARLDPGSYRIRMRVADAWLGRGLCAKARPHALAARDLFPNAPAPKRLLARCPGGE